MTQVKKVELSEFKKKKTGKTHGNILKTLDDTLINPTQFWYRSPFEGDALRLKPKIMYRTSMVFGGLEFDGLTEKELEL